MLINRYGKKISEKNILKNIIKSNFFFTLTKLVFLLSLFVILIGPYVRAEDAGLACPDWPLCHGYVIPPLDYQIYLEFIHRVVAGILGIFFSIWFFTGMIKKEIRSYFLPYLLLSGMVLIIQIFLGRETITKQLNAYIVKFHLLNAIFFISIIYYILFQFTKKNIENINISKNILKEIRLLMILFLLGIYLQIFFGGRVSANYVGLVCPEFPECYSEIIKIHNLEILKTTFIPPLIYGFEMHFTHRFFAFFLLIVLFYLVYHFYKNNLLKKEITFLLSLFVFQIFLGILNIVFELPTLIRVLHSFTATILFLTTVHIILTLNLLIDKKNNYNL